MSNQYVVVFSIYDTSLTESSLRCWSIENSETDPDSRADHFYLCESVHRPATNNYS